MARKKLPDLEEAYEIIYKSRLERNPGHSKQTILYHPVGESTYWIFFHFLFISFCVYTTTFQRLY